jgi:two-component system OmpR family response regulator
MAHPTLSSHALRIAMPDPLRVVILDTDTDFVADLGAAFARLGWKCRVLSAPVSSWSLARTRAHALVVDPAALAEDWLPCIGALAHELPEMRIVFCSRSSSLDDRCAALRVGVDDWIAKSCDLEEILARIESVVRGPHHIGPALDERPLIEAELTISPMHRQAFAHGVSARLTAREFSLLHLLAGQQGRVVDRASAYLHVWGYPMVKRDRSVDVHVRRIRGKLRRISPEWSYIHTQYQIGYRFRADREHSQLGSHALARQVPLAV